MDILRQLTTAKTDDGQVIATVSDYYDRFVHALGDDYKKSSFKKDKLVLCPFHGDVNPSMGLLKDKLNKDVEVFNCFGCGASGTVAHMHRRVTYLKEKRKISLEVAIQELATLYNIVLDSSKAEEELKSLIFKRESDIAMMVDHYNYRTHSKNILKLRQNQDKLAPKDLAENIDVLLNKWKLAIKE